MPILLLDKLTNRRPLVPASVAVLRACTGRFMTTPSGGYQTYCDKWDCRRCGVRRLKRTRARVALGCRVLPSAYAVTFKLLEPSLVSVQDGKRLQVGISAVLNVVRQKCRRLVDAGMPPMPPSGKTALLTAIVATEPLRQLIYFYAYAFTPHGGLHAHGLVGWLPVEWLAAEPDSNGGRLLEFSEHGVSVYIKGAKNAAGWADYVLGGRNLQGLIRSDVSLPRNFRRVVFSRNFPITASAAAASVDLEKTAQDAPSLGVQEIPVTASAAASVSVAVDLERTAQTASNLGVQKVPVAVQEPPKLARRSLFANAAALPFVGAVLGVVWWFVSQARAP